MSDRADVARLPHALRDNLWPGLRGRARVCRAKVREPRFGARAMLLAFFMAARRSDSSGDHRLCKRHFRFAPAGLINPQSARSTPR